MTPAKIVSKIFIAIFSLISILLILGDWLSSGGTVFEIVEFLAGLGRFSSSPVLPILGISLVLLAISAIILFVVGTIVSLASREVGGVSKAAGILALILASLFLGLILYVNSELGSSRYTIFEPSACPILLLFTSLTVVIFSSVLISRSTTSVPSSTPIINKGLFCTRCGFSIATPTNFCPNCSQPLNAPHSLSRRYDSHDDNLLRQGGWICTRCRRVNPSYTGTCSCGNPKQ